MKTFHGSLTIAGKPAEDFIASFGLDAEARYKVTHQISRPSLLRHPIARWRWRRVHGKTKAITTTLYHCKVEEARPGELCLTPELPDGGEL